METSHLMVILSSIVLCFIVQTFILNTRMSESLTSVEETLQKTRHQVESLSEERLDKVSGIIEKSGKSFAETMQDVPSVISHLKEVYASQNVHEEKFLQLLSKLEEQEAEDDTKTPISEETFNKAMDQLATKMEAKINRLQESCGDKTDKAMYITVSFRQFFWFVLGILILMAVQGFFKVENNDDVKDYTGIIAMAILALIIIVVIFHASQ